MSLALRAAAAVAMLSYEELIPVPSMVVRLSCVA
jgi:hypothetical protein